MNPPRVNSLAKVLRFLDRLEGANLHYCLGHVRDSIMVAVAVPGERWEIEFFVDGTVEVERFVSTGAIEGEGLLDYLIAEHGS